MVGHLTPPFLVSLQFVNMAKSQSYFALFKGRVLGLNIRTWLLVSIKRAKDLCPKLLSLENPFEFI